jgi:YidC/Oxa1 family membrane protein insertase
MEKRLLLAAGLSLAVLILWELVVPRPKPAPAVPGSGKTAPAAAEVAAAASAPAPVAVAPPVSSAAPPVSASDQTSTVIENGSLRLTLDNRGGLITSAILSKYQDEQKQPLELVRQLPAPATRPLALEFPGHPDLTARAASALYAVEKLSDRGARLRFSDGQFEATKEIRLGDGYLFHVAVSVVGPPYRMTIGSGLRNPAENEIANRYVMPASVVAASVSGLQTIRVEKLEKQEKGIQWAVPATGFAGIEDNYFLLAFLPGRATEVDVVPVVTKDAAGKPTSTVSAALSASGALSARAYFGPKDVEILESLHAGLDRTVDFGWYGILARPLLWLLKRTYTWVGNYGLAILLVTLLIRIALFPLMHKSYASMKKMQKLAPKMNAIKDKYKKAKTDAAQRAKMNQELMTLYQAEGYNPMSGCLPIVLQLPILVAFYNVLSRSIELRHAPFALWIKDLSAVDHTYVLLILMIVSMYVQQAMTPTTVDPAQKKIFMAMPLLWGFFLKDMPSGLVLYWLFSNILTILQQVLINKIVKDDEPVPARVSGRKARIAQAKGAGR